MSANLPFINRCYPILILLLCLGWGPVSAQDSALTYQGRLTDASIPANGTYDFQFVLYSALTGGTQIGTTQTVTGLQVTGGTFTTSLDFGAAAFPGASRFLEIRVKAPADPSYTPLTPRQPVTSSPYALRTLSSASADTAANATNAVNATNAANAATLGGIDSAGFIRNQTAAQSANLHVTGTGTFDNGVTANGVTANSTGNIVVSGQSSSSVGTWLRLNNTSPGGHSWNVISTGSGNSEGAGKLLFNDQTSGGTRMQLDGTGVTVNGNLTVSGTVNSTVPNCKARQTSTQLFPNSNIILMRMDATQFCSGVTFDNTNDQFVIVTPGLYQITGEVLFLTNNSGLRFLAINASSGEIAGATVNAALGFTTYLTTSGLTRLNAGDAVNLIAAQSSGGNLGTEVFSGRSASLSLNWVGP